MNFAYLIEPPFNYIDTTGRVTGCDVELARHVLAEIGIADIEPIETEFSELLPGVGSGRWRMTTGLIVSDERRKRASFSRTIWAQPDGMLVASGNRLELSGYQPVADNSDVRLAVIRDQFQHHTAVEFDISTDGLRYSKHIPKPQKQFVMALSAPMPASVVRMTALLNRIQNGGWR